MLEDRPESRRVTKPVTLSPFPVDPVFQRLSYAGRYEIVCQRLVRERLYDAACFFTSDAERGIEGHFSEPSAELSIRNFAVSLHAHVAAFVALRRR